MITIKSLNISEKKGTIKNPVESAFVTYQGFEDDAHAGPWHRQVSLLASEHIDAFMKKEGMEVIPGAFGENITTAGYDLSQLKILDVLRHKEVVLQVTQLGKSCHGKGCSIYTQVGKCVMPAEGVFCRVVLQGDLTTGDSFEHVPHVFKAMVITLSDRASQGVYEDKSGKLAVQLLEECFKEQGRQVAVQYELIPDDAKQLEALVKSAIKKNYDIVLTTGGTGIGTRDITPEVIKPLLLKEIPGIMEFIRATFGAEKPGALLSRSVAGVADKTFIVTMPGSTKGVEEYMSVLKSLFLHTIYMLQGIDKH